MKLPTMPVPQKLLIILLSSIAFNPANAASDTHSKHGNQVQQAKEHAKHLKQRSQNQEYHGVFYGFLPCKGCDGIKATLSLKTRNNYLLVTQQAKASSREYFEKGKYTWDDDTNILTLKPRKDSAIRKYRINDEKTLEQLSPQGKPIKSKQKRTSYVLRKQDKEQTRTSVHMH